MSSHLNSCFSPFDWTTSKSMYVCIKYLLVLDLFSFWGEGGGLVLTKNPTVTHCESVWWCQKRLNKLKPPWGFSLSETQIFCDNQTIYDLSCGTMRALRYLYILIIHGSVVEWRMKSNNYFFTRVYLKVIRRLNFILSLQLTQRQPHLLGTSWTWRPKCKPKAMDVSVWH